MVLGAALCYTVVLTKLNNGHCPLFALPSTPGEVMTTVLHPDLLEKCIQMAFVGDIAPPRELTRHSFVTVLHSYGPHSEADLVEAVAKLVAMADAHYARKVAKGEITPDRAFRAIQEVAVTMEGDRSDRNFLPNGSVMRMIVLANY